MSIELQNNLQRVILGKVLWNDEILKFYSVDASSYQIMPKIIVIPKNENDIVKTIKIAKKFQTSVTVRGGGTGLVGNSLNSGIILDLKNLDDIKIKEDYVIVGPGVSKGKLDKLLKARGKFFPPNPSVGQYCKIGGMLGNNASGSKSLKYGSVIDNVMEITFVSGDGDIITLPQNISVGKKILTLAKKISYSDIPAVTKNSSGYRLDQVTKKDNTHKAIIGSEGTLGIITSVQLKIIDIPKNRILYIIAYNSTRDAAKDCPAILKTKPAAIEFVDSQTLREFKLGLDDNTKCLIFVEYDSGFDSIKQIEQNRKIIKKLDSDETIQRWWRMRDLSLYHSIKSIKLKDRFPHIIEDATVPVEKLVQLFEIIDKLNKRFNTNTITYGHAGNGNIHVRLLGDNQDYNKIANYYFKRVIKLGGSISGEHGDGIARTKFVKSQYGLNYEIFTKLKNLLDPHNILNPGKIIST